MKFLALFITVATSSVDLIFCRFETASFGSAFGVQADTNSPFPRRQFSDSSKLKEFTDDNFKFDENGKMFSRWIENSVGKGEIARYEQFLLFPQCFQKICTADT